MMAKKETSKADEWKQHLTRWRKSALSQRAFCQQNQLCYYQFGYWKKRLSIAAPVKATLLPVVIQSDPVSLENKTVVLHMGRCRVDLPLSMDTRVMIQLLKALS